MFKRRFRLYSLAKLNSLEILIEERIQYVGSSQSRFFETYLKNQKILKRRVIITKIFSSIIFSVLPLIPLLTFIEIDDTLVSGGYSIDVIVFTGSLLFSLYFLLQFFNFFLLGIFNVSLIISGRIFRWYETFPLSRDKLRKLVHLTIFRSLDLPIFVSLLAFPIIILIGTQNLIMCLVCAGISFLITYISFNLLIIVGERLNRTLDINEIGSKKTFGLRMFNMFSYFVIIVSSVYTIQWALGSLDILFDWFLNIENSRVFNLIFSVIIFPFTPSYLISLFITPLDVPLELWLMTLLGLSILILLVIRLNSIALKNLEKSTYLKYGEEKIKYQTLYGRKSVKIKTNSPVMAYIRKDLLTASRNLKTFMAFVMPIILSLVFKFSFNLSMLGIAVPIEFKFVYEWMMIIAFNLILTAMITHNLLNIEESGETILASLPLIPREQAISKLVLIIIVQILAILAPNFVFINTPLFFGHLIVSLLAIPVAIMFLMIIFEMRVYYFGKIRNRYILSEIQPQNAIVKWVLILLSNFFFFYWFMILGINMFIYMGIESILTLTLMVLFVSFIPIAIVFDSLFPHIKLPKQKTIIEIREFQKSSGKKYKPTFFTNHKWISIFLIIILFFTVEFVSIFFTQFWFFPPVYPQAIEYIFRQLLAFVVFNLLFVVLIFVIIPKIFGIPNGRQSIVSFLKDINLEFLQKSYKKLILGVASGLLFIIFLLICEIIFTGLPSTWFDLNINQYFSTILMLILYQIWYEIIFRGIILNLLSQKYSTRVALSIVAFLSLGILFSPFSLIHVIYSSFSLNPIIKIGINFVLGYYFGYLSLRTKSLFPSFCIIILTTLLGVNPFYY